jgi:transketolase
LAEIAAVLYFAGCAMTPPIGYEGGRDRFLLSKRAWGPGTYAALAESGYFPMEKLDGLKERVPLCRGIPTDVRLSGIEANYG